MAVAAQKGRVRWWYDSIIDWMIANPGGTQRECARALNKGETTISLIVNSDVFKARLAERRRDWVERHDLAIIQKTTKIALLALDGTIEKLEKKRDCLPLGQLVDVSEKSLARLGYGVQTPKGPGVTVNVGAQAGAQVVQVDRETLAGARQHLREVQSRKVIEVDFQPVSEANRADASAEARNEKEKAEPPQSGEEQA